MPRPLRFGLPCPGAGLALRYGTAGFAVHEHFEGPGDSDG
jgi:hypothetical protein